MWFCPGKMRDDDNETVEVNGVGVEDGVLGGVGLPPWPMTYKEMACIILMSLLSELLSTFQYLLVY